MYICNIYLKKKVPVINIPNIFIDFTSHYWSIYMWYERWSILHSDSDLYRGNSR